MTLFPSIPMESMESGDSGDSANQFRMLSFVADVYQKVDFGTPWKINFQSFSKKDPRGTSRRLEWRQRDPKGAQSHSQGSKREPKASPKVTKGTPKSAQRKPQARQRHPWEARGTGYTKDSFLILVSSFRIPRANKRGSLTTPAWE